jgi:hypothetical protein
MRDDRNTGTEPYLRRGSIDLALSVFRPDVRRAKLLLALAGGLK